MIKQGKKGKKVPIEQFIDVICLTGPYNILGLAWLLNKKLSWKLQLLHDLTEQCSSSWFGYYDISSDSWTFLIDSAWLKKSRVKLPFNAISVLFMVGDFFLYHKDDVWNDITLLQEDIYVFELPVNFRKKMIKNFKQCLITTDMSR
ncbi:MAG: hypothetical protein GXO48_08360 [Chlorobi bacterium]|nr:hypothetical protein [Chlorobiota bacterium]